MRKKFIGLVLLSSLIFLFTSQAAFSREILTISLSKNVYTIGENVTIKVEVYNPYNKSLVANWFFDFEPPLEESAGSYGKVWTLAPGDYREKIYMIEAEILGQHSVVGKVLDSNGKLFYETNETQFVVVPVTTPINNVTSVATPVVDMAIPLMIIAVLVLIAIVYIIFYKRRNKKNQ